MDNDTYDDRTNIRFLKQEEFNANVVKRLEELEDFTVSCRSRLDQEIENRTKAFERIEENDEKIELLERYTIKGIESKIRDTIFNTSTTSERHDDILTVHRNEIDNLKKDNNAMKQIMNNYLMVNLDNPEYITKVHEKRGTHGTSNTKGKEPR